LIDPGEVRWWVEWLVESRKDGYWLRNRLLGHVRALQLSALAEEAIAWAVDDLETTTAEEREIEESLLASVASEKLVEDVLVPRLKEADEPLRSNLVTVIRKAGERHRRRYVTTSGQPLNLGL
jgi:hypothetical protein